jgi:hypothetical protein
VLQPSLMRIRRNLGEHLSYGGQTVAILVFGMRRTCWPLVFLTLYTLTGLAGCSRKPEPCRIAIRSQERSPNQLKAVVFLRKCPDEVLFTTNVSILPIDQSVADDTGNTVVCPDALAVRVKWQGNSQLTVLSFSDLAGATKQKQVGNVSIDYPHVSNPDLFQPPNEEPDSTPSATP